MDRLGVSVEADLELARTVLREQGAPFVLVSGGRIVEIGSGHGVVPLVLALERLEPTGIKGAALADKLIGRAAALAAIHAELGAVHGEFMSRAAVDELTRYGIPFSYGVQIPAVLNRSGSHLCPFEELVASAATPEEAVRRLREAARSKGGPAPDPQTPSPAGSEAG